MARTVLIVDDHDGFRAVARAVLELEGFEVVGEAGDGPEALQAVESLRPEVVLLDVMLPGIDGFEVARRLSAGAGCPTIVLTSTRTAGEYAHALRATPARGFLSKRDLSGSAVAEIIERPIEES